MSNEKKKSKVLNVAKSYKVMRWMERNWKRIEEERLTREKAAALCTQELGFEVTWVHIRNRVKDLGKHWPGAVRSSGTPGRPKDRTAYLARQILLLNEKVEYILEQETGIDKEGLQAIVRHQSYDRAPPQDPPSGNNQPAAD